MSVSFCSYACLYSAVQYIYTFRVLNFVRDTCLWPLIILLKGTMYARVRVCLYVHVCTGLVSKVSLGVFFLAQHGGAVVLMTSF